MFLNSPVQCEFTRGYLVDLMLNQWECKNNNNSQLVSGWVGGALLRQVLSFDVMGKPWQTNSFFRIWPRVPWSSVVNLGGM